MKTTLLILMLLAPASLNCHAGTDAECAPCYIAVSGTVVWIYAPGLTPPIIIIASNDLHNWVEVLWSRTNPAVMHTADPGPDHFYKVREAQPQAPQ